MTTNFENDDRDDDAEKRLRRNLRAIQIVGQFPDEVAGGGATIFDAFQVLWRNITVIGLVSFVATAMAVLYALLATPIYRSDLLLAPAKEISAQSSLLGQLGGLASIAGVSVGGTGNAEAIAVLKSRDFTRGFIEDNDLMPILFEAQWDFERKDWKSKDPDDRPDIRDGIDRFDRSIRTVQEDKVSGLVRVAINWRDPEHAAAWANSLVDRLNSHMRARALHEASTNIEYLREELARTNVLTLQQSIGRLLEGELQKLMLARGSEEFVYRIIDRAEVANRRSKPRRVLIAFFGAVFGFILAVMFVLVREGFRRQKAEVS